MRVRIMLTVFCAMVLFAAGSSGAPSGVTFEKGEGRIDVLIDGKPFTAYYHTPDLTRPFFHPLRAADGTVVTRGFPMIRDLEAEKSDRDHPHHRSCWFSFGDVEGVDYWADNARVQGKIVHRSVDKMEGGPQKGTFAVTMDWLDNTGKKVLVQKQEVVFHGDATKRYMDFAITLSPAEGKVTMRDTKEGMFGVRLATPLKQNNGGVITNSHGAVGEKSCWGKKAEWVDYSGELEGKRLGLTMMDHPGNLRHPTTWHVRAYGLFAANPFGIRDFTGDKSQDGSHTIEPGSSLTFRYRILIHPGNAAEAGIEQEYRRYVRDSN